MLIGRRVEVRGRGHRRRIVIAYCHPWYSSRGNGYGTLHRDEKIACEKIRVEVAERRRKTQLFGGDPTVCVAPFPAGSGSTLQPFLQIRGGHRISVYAHVLGEEAPEGLQTAACHRDQLPLDGSFDQAVFDLQADEGRPSAQLGKCIRLRDPPRGGIRNSDVEHLALANQIVQSAHDFFDWRNLVPHVDPVQVDVVGLQSLETRFHCLHHTFAVIAGRVRIYTLRSHGVFASHYHTLAMAFHELAEKRFARSICVKVGGVDEISASLAEGVVHLARLILSRTPAPFIAEGHGAKCRLRNSKSGVAQKSISQRNFLFPCLLSCFAHLWPPRFTHEKSLALETARVTSGIRQCTCRTRQVSESPLA